jgi:NIMA (never in mitosis gene a)-related kinase
MEDTRKLKLGDFGISKEMKNSIDLSKTMIGSPYYISPEAINSR